MSEQMNRRAFTASALGAAFLPAAPALGQSKQKVVISWLPIMQTTAFYVALDRKLFDKAGIDVEAARFEAPNQIIDSLVSGRADLGAPGAAAGITALAQAKFPGTFKVFGLQGGSIKLNRINDGLIVDRASTIKTFADLRGKSLGHLPGIQWRTISRHMVRLAGLDPDKDIRLVELAVGLQVAALIAGTVDATLSLEPVGSIAVALGQAKRAITNPCAAAIADPFYSGVSVLTTKFLGERPEIAAKVVEVLDEATRIANAEFDTVRQILPKYTAVKVDQTGVVAQPYLRGFSDLDATDIASYQALVDLFYSEHVLSAPMKVEDLMLKKTEVGL